MKTEKIWTSNFKERYEALKEAHKDFQKNYEERLLSIRRKTRTRIVVKSSPNPNKDIPPRMVVISVWGIESVVSYEDYKKKMLWFLNNKKNILRAYEKVVYHGSIAACSGCE